MFKKFLIIEIKLHYVLILNNVIHILIQHKH